MSRRAQLRQRRLWRVHVCVAQIAWRGYGFSIRSSLKLVSDSGFKGQPELSNGKNLVESVGTGRSLTHPLAELSNNLAENFHAAYCRRTQNWLHIGSRQAGPKVAAILSVVEPCRRLNLPVRAYLAAVLPGLEKCTLRQVTELARWAARRPNS